MQASWKRIFTAFVLLTGCSSSGPDGSASSSVGGSVGGDEVEYSGESLEGGAIQAVTIDADTGEGSVSLSNLTGSETYILAVYSYNNEGDSQTLSLASLNEEASGNEGDSSAAVKMIANTPDLTEDLHNNLRLAESALNPEEVVMHPTGVRFLATDPEVGSQRTFKVINGISSVENYSTVTSTLRYKNDDYLIYVDNRDASSLDDDDIEEITASFDSSAVQAQRDMFGSESDVDGNGRFIIHFTRVVNQMGGSSGGIITGFFYAIDLLSNDTYDQSNEAEVITTYVPDPDGDLGTAISLNFSLSNIYPTVLPHEFQHMISYNQHVFVSGGAPEESWLNEALSHFAEDFEGAGAENPSRVSGYLAQTDSLCFTCGASLYQRGGSFLFIRYLYEQAEKGNLSGAASGEEFIAALMGDLTGEESVINAAYGDSFVEERMVDLMGRFGLAMFLDGTGLSTDDRLEVDALDLRGSQDDNRGTILQGPAIEAVDSFPVSSTLAGASVAYYQMSGQDILDAGGSVGIEVADPSTTGAYLIQVGL